MSTSQDRPQILSLGVRPIAACAVLLVFCLAAGRAVHSYLVRRDIVSAGGTIREDRGASGFGLSAEEVQFADRPVSSRQIQALTALRQIRVLHLTACEIRVGTDPDRLPTVESIVLDRCRLDRDFIELLASWRSLRTVAMRRMTLSDEHCLDLARLEQIETLIVSESELGAKGMIELRRLPRLKTFVARESNIASDSFAGVSTSPGLEVIEVACSHLTDAVMEHIRLSGTVRVLDISGNPISAGGASLLSRCDSLRYLDVSGTAIGCSQLRDVTFPRGMETLVCQCANVDGLSGRFPTLRIREGWRTCED